MVNVKDHKSSEIFLTVGLVEPIKFVLRSVIYIFSDSLRHVKFSLVFRKKIVRFSKQNIYIFSKMGNFKAKSSVTAHRTVFCFL